MGRRTKYVDPEVLGALELKLATKGRLTIREAAKVIDVHYHTLLSYVHAGKVLTLTINTRQVICEDEVNRIRREGLKPSKTTEEPSGSSSAIPNAERLGHG